MSSVAAESCPACGGGELSEFHAVDNVPIQSNLLAPTREAALALPRANLRIAVCASCGLIFNTAFDPATQDFSNQYEVAQGFSPTFTGFAKSLAEDWSRKYLKPESLAVEIGCGDGQFIRLLSDVAACRGIGIDPSVLPFTSPDGRLQLIGDFYSDAYANLIADFFCCRHTLEHIANPREFLQMLRRVTGNNPSAVVAFEVPETFRVLRETAFWDLYYEHCSYFTPGSLARLLRAAGFDLLDLRVEYQGQYLIVEARAAATPTHGKFEAENDLGVILTDVESFRGKCVETLDSWRQLIADRLATGGRIALWGAGSKAVGFLTTLGLTDAEVRFVVDINPRKQDTYLPGAAARIVAPQAMRAFNPTLVIIMNPIYRAEIGQQLRSLGQAPELLALE